MKNEEMLNRAEDLIEENIPSGGDEKNATKSSGSKVKPAIACFLFLVLAGSVWNAWNQIKQMSAPPDIPREVVLENMGAYLFMTVSKLNSHIERTGGIPETELDFLGWDDPSVEYSFTGPDYSVSVHSGDTVLVWHSGEDSSEFLTEEALQRMGIVN